MSFLEQLKYQQTKLPTDKRLHEKYKKENKTILKSGVAPANIWRKEVEEYEFQSYQEINEINPDGAVAYVEDNDFVQDYDNMEQGLIAKQIFDSQGLKFNYFLTDKGLHVHGKFNQPFEIKDGLTNLFLMIVDVKCNLDNNRKKAWISMRKHGEWLRPLGTQYLREELDEFPWWSMPLLKGKFGSKGKDLTPLTWDNFNDTRNSNFRSLNEELYKTFNGQLTTEQRLFIGKLYYDFIVKDHTDFPFSEVKTSMRDWDDFKPNPTGFQGKAGDIYNPSDTDFWSLNHEFLHWKMAEYLIKKHQIKLYGNYLWKLTPQGYQTDKKNKWVNQEVISYEHTLTKHKRKEVYAYIEEKLTDLHTNGKRDIFNYLNFRNGSLNTKTFDFQPTITTEFTPYYLDIEYDPKFDINHPIESQYFEAIFADIFADNHEWFDLLEQWVGYHFTLGHPAKAFMQVYGRTNAGKTLTFSHFIDPIFENNNSKLALEELDKKDGYNFELWNSLSNVSADETKKFLTNGGFFKKATGDDAIRIRQIYGEPLYIYPSTKFTIISNHKIGFNTEDLALKERLHILRFNQDLEQIERFHNRSVWNNLSDWNQNQDKLCARWMLFKAIPAVKRLKENKWQFPIVDQEVVDDYKNTYNDFEQWFEAGIANDETESIDQYDEEFFIGKTASEIAVMVESYKRGSVYLYEPTKAEINRAAENVKLKYPNLDNKEVSWRKNPIKGKGESVKCFHRKGVKK